MKKGLIYISGPITGRPQLNVSAFRDAEDKIRALGLKTIVPHDLMVEMDTTGMVWEDYMRTCIKALMDCSAVVTLPDWEESPGAQLEVHIARKLNIKVYPIFNIDRMIHQADEMATENVEA